jgi:hypothetical protein
LIISPPIIAGTLAGEESRCRFALFPLLVTDSTASVVEA